MRQWEIYLFPYRDEQPHPVVILSNDERCANETITHVNGPALHFGAIES